MYIYLVGKPCSGKDTIARFISEEYGFKHLLVGKMVAEYISNTYGSDSDEMKNFYKGYIHDSNLAIDLLDKIIAQNHANILFDGFPRTKNQFDKHIHNTGKIKKLMLLLDISDQEAIERMQKRVVCSVCYRSQINNNQTHCVFCISEGLYKRKDDSLEAMKVRLEEFAKKTNYIFNIKSDKYLNLYVKLINVTAKGIQQVLDEVDSYIKEC